MSSDTGTAGLETESDAGTLWNQLIEALAAGHISMMDVMQQAKEALWKNGDHEGYVTAMRAMHVMMSDPRLLKRLADDTGAELERLTGRPAQDAIKKQQRDVRAKDGFRLFDKLSSVQEEAYADAPPMLEPGLGFQEALATYHRLILHVEDVWNNACEAFMAKRFPLAVFFSILAIEEIGKLGRLWRDLLAWDQLKKADRKMLSRRHPQKHFLALVSGAVVNARLDRILGAKRLKKVLEDAESGALERLRQACLYIDVADGKPVFPDDVVTEEDARFYTVLAGELWAEILGHFPWEFEEMLTKVIAFEEEIGFDPEIVARA